MDWKYLQELAKQFPSSSKVATEIVNLQSILSLPKGTEHFLSDIHGEDQQFFHVLRNGSGAVRRKIEEEFGTFLTEQEKRELATLIYYPEETMALAKKKQSNLEDWYVVMMNRLIRICKSASSKYTRSKVRKSLPEDYAYIVEELITGRRDLSNQESYYQEIIATSIRIGKAPEFIVVLCDAISRFVIDHLHIVGDIFDRGPGPHICLDLLMHYHSVDVQWGNHDVLWMGAAAGQLSCIATVVRFSARYGNLDVLEDGYGINLMPLMKFALETYGEDPCACFQIRGREKACDAFTEEMDRKMHKAMTIMQLKLEGKLILRHPEFHMEDRLLLDKMDLKKGIVHLTEGDFPLLDTYFPTLNEKDPYALTKEEQEVIEKLQQAFLHCEKLQNHVRFLFQKGSLYKCFNQNLLFHGCVPLDEYGHLREVKLYGKTYRGKALFDQLEKYIRRGYYALDAKEKEMGMDMMWYTWTHGDSPLFGKKKMAIFERYFIQEKETHIEKKDPYYKWYEKDETVDMILRDFQLTSSESRIINGHIPVESKMGESPIKCGGRLLVIDGGFSKAYRPKTGIAGYTLTYNSYGFLLASHEPFISVEHAVQTGQDIHSDTVLVQHVKNRQTVADTDVGKKLGERIYDLECLLDCYRKGQLAEMQ